MRNEKKFSSAGALSLINKVIVSGYLKEISVINPFINQHCNQLTFDIFLADENYVFGRTTFYD